MKKVQYKDKYGREVTKKEGFSFPLFILLLILGIVPGLIYLFAKGGFMALRGAIRTINHKGSENPSDAENN